MANAGAGDRHLAKAPKTGHNVQNPSRIEKHWTTAFLKIRTPAAHGRRFLSCVGDHLPPAGPYGSGWSKRGEPNPRSQRGRLMYWPFVRRLQKCRHCSLRRSIYGATPGQCAEPVPLGVHHMDVETVCPALLRFPCYHHIRFFSRFLCPVCKR